MQTWDGQEIGFNLIGGNNLLVQCSKREARGLRELIKE
jgi:hypothetical protein